jgi:RNA polymerase sigma-70 factor, Bacteroides expansion family 1
MTFSENDILEQIKQGNMDAFEKLYFDLQPRLYAFSRKFIDDIEQAKDAVQDVFLEFWERRQTINVQTSVRSYLFAMIQNKCLNLIRTQKQSDRYNSYAEIKLKEAELYFYEDDQTAYKSIFFKEIESIFDKSVAELPDNQREIFVLSRQEGLSNKEIAERLDISVRTVENHIYRSLKRLRESLKDFYILIPLFQFTFCIILTNR